jgi:Zn-dependent protease
LTEPSYHPNPTVRRLQSLSQTSWPLFTAFRVRVRASWTIAIIPLLFAWSFAKWMPFGEAVAWGAAWTVALFTTVWTHEMGHIAMGRRCGIETDRITLRALGGLAHLEAPAQSPGDEIRISLAGPATHLLWMAVAFPAAWLLESAHHGELWYWMLRGFAAWQISMVIFNLLPVYPMDGGAALRGALSLRMHANRASYLVANLGFVGNAAYLVLGILSWLRVADPFGYGPFGFLLAWIGIWGIQLCRRLRLTAKYGEVYASHDPFQKTLLASQAAVRDMEEEERSERRASRDRRARLEEELNRLLDRINEEGGVANLSSRERRALERVRRELAEE